LRQQQIVQEEVAVPPYNSNVAARMTHDEAKAVMALHDRHADVMSDAPTVTDVAETLGASAADVTGMLDQIRREKAAAEAKVAQENAARKNEYDRYGAYAATFRQFDANNGKFAMTWNTSAFLFGGFWYLSKGMVVKFWLYLLAALVAAACTAGFSVLLAPLVLAFIANYDYYLFERRKTQFWESDKSRQVTPVTPFVAPVGLKPVVAANSEVEAKIRVLREAFDRGLVTREEYEAKREAIVCAVEYQEDLQKLDEAYRLGVLTLEEYDAKRQKLLRGDDV